MTSLGNWIAVACGEHVRRGRDGGFMQVCHGKRAPLQRIAPMDRVIYYSSTQSFGNRTRLQAFTAIGIVAGGEPYQIDMGAGFCPFRRDVTWLEAQMAPIAPLLGSLEFAGGRGWGAHSRFGLLEISDHDCALIAAAMGVVPAWNNNGCVRLARRSRPTPRRPPASALV